MKIRKKITLWISGTALISTIIFSLFLVVELVETPFSMIDKELQYTANALVHNRQLLTETSSTIASPNLTYNLDQYWIKMTNHQGKLLYRSAIAQYTELPSLDDKTTYNIERHIPREQVWLGQDAHNDVAFRVRIIESAVGSTPVTIKIARPIEDMEEEYISLLPIA